MKALTRYITAFAGLLASFVAESGAAESKKPAKPPDLRNQRVGEYFRIEKIAVPADVDSQVGAMAGMPDGRLAVAFHRGEVAFYDPKVAKWQMFAEGLHEPLGILPEADGSLLVMQRPELTRLRDTTGAGVANVYETVWDGFGMTGNYHEFAFGPVRGPNGKLYVALNLASNGATIHEEIRGEWCPFGLKREKFYNQPWAKSKAAAGRMYSRVPWRGWIMEIDPLTGTSEPFACGFRSPNGIGFDPAGNFLVDDNQGDWLGASHLYVVKRGGFYGHPASLVWRKGWSGGDPLRVPVKTLSALRTLPAIQFPYGTYSNSPTQIVTIPKTPAWGAFGGQIIAGEMNAAHLLRILLDPVDDVWQGACIPFIDMPALGIGVNRLAFTGDTLWIGRIHLTWAGASGIGSVIPTGKEPFDLLSMHVTPHGFRLEFTKPLAATVSDPALWPARRYTYLYRAPYGSPEVEKAPVVFSKVTLSADARSADVEISDLKTDLIYDLDLRLLKSASGENPLNGHVAYTLLRVPKK